MIRKRFLEWASRFPEGLLLVSGKGEILACNPAFVELASGGEAHFVGCNLCDFATVPEENVHDALRLWSGSGRMTYGINLQIDELKLRCEGALAERNGVGAEPVLMVRVKQHELVIERFRILTQKVDELSREIHARRRSEEEVLRQREWLHVTLSSIGDAVIATDAEGRVIFMNAVAEALTGWETTAALGQPMTTVFSIFSEETGEIAENPVERVLREGVIVGLANHTVLRSRNGGEVPIEDSAAPIRASNGELIGVVLVFHDVTDKRDAQYAMKLSRDEALAASRTKDEFLSALSHELRTPLNPVLLLATEAAARESLPWKIRRDFDVIAKNVALEARLIDDLLDLTRLNKGDVSLTSKTVDLHAVLSDAAATVQSGMNGTGQTLDFELRAENRLVIGEAVRLQQVFWNLLENAMKFSPGKSRIHLRSRNSDDGACIVITITDEGIGMNPDELARIFDPFSQGDHVRRGGIHRGGGLGLGLTLSRRLVELHSGQIDVFSSGPGKGSTVTVTLPVKTESAKSALKPHGPPVVHPYTAFGKRVLLVEDHPPTLAVLTHLLSMRGFEVVSAATMAEALHSAENGRFDLVVSDIGLPDGDGYALMKNLRERFQLTGLAVSGFGREEDIARSRAAGFSDHLIKPISIQRLEQALATLPTSPADSGPACPDCNDN